MKTIMIMITVTIVLSLFVTGCGNMDIVDWHWTFDRARIRADGDKWEEVQVKRWHDYEGSDMIAIETESKVYVTHSFNVILIKNK